MNKPHPKTRLTPGTPPLALVPAQNPLCRETALRATSCLSSRPPLPQTPAEVIRQVFDPSPEFSTVARTALNAARPMRQTQPEDHLHREPAPGPLRNGNPRGNPNLAPRCGARTRLGCPCKGPAMKNGRCRMHGGAATGPRTDAGRARIAAARTVHGRYSATAGAARIKARGIIERSRVLGAIVDTGLPIEVIAPLINQVRGKTPCAVSDGPITLMTTDLTRQEGIRLARLIRPYAP
jgi:hypothetical protein